MLQSSDLKYLPDLVTLGGVGGGDRKILENMKIEVSFSYEWVVGS